MQKTKLNSELELLKKQVIKSIEAAPQGRLRCEMLRGKYPQYYIVEGDDLDHPHGRYIRKSDIEIARQLAQKEYDYLMLKEIKKLERMPEYTRGTCNIAELGNVHAKLPEAKRRLVIPYIEDNVSFAANWEKSLVGSANDYPISNGYITERGETVRSKSEKIIADKLLLMGIPYVYEAKLNLNNGMTVYPDFTILNVRTREVFFYEHFGMMDNPEYCNKAIEKIDLYESNGLYVGEKFLFTMESSQRGINLTGLNSIIKRKLL